MHNVCVYKSSKAFLFFFTSEKLITAGSIIYNDIIYYYCTYAITIARPV